MVSNYSTLVATSEALEKFFALLHFNNDLTRIIYASNQYCFDERTRKQSNGLLNLPFQNYWLSNFDDKPNSRLLRNFETHVNGLQNIDNYQEKIGGILRLIPVKLTFESTIFSSSIEGSSLNFQSLIDASHNEVELVSYYETENRTIIKCPNFVHLDLQWNPEYKETDWLVKNHITTIAATAEVTTFLVLIGSTQISYSRTVTLDFIQKKMNSQLTIDDVDNYISQIIPIT